jgi:HAD superfamily hydrolase (TIGR01450 family)
VSGSALDRYDLVILDLDGVVYLGTEPIPGAAEAISRLHGGGRQVAYATNNAGRSPQEVAALLVSLGIKAGADEVVTSPQAAGRLLAQRLPAKAAVLVVGSDALRAQIDAAGLTPVDDADSAPVAVVQGYGPEVGWRQLAEASVAIRGGALWVATNTDRTLPSPRGPLPGNGAMVAALSTALERTPDVIVGKPEPALFVEAAARVGAHRPLVVGDRLDTDIEGANRAGMDSVLVLTGVASPRDALSAPAGRRPTLLAADLAELSTVDNSTGRWTVRREADTLVLSGDGTAMEALRCLCAEAWHGAQPARPVPDGDAAERILRELNLADRTGA